MVKARYKDIEASSRPPPEPKSWAEANTTLNKQPGWVRKSNDEYKDELKKKRHSKPHVHPKNSGQKCDHCVMDDHEKCWRAYCYCECVKDRFKGDGWPARKFQL